MRALIAASLLVGACSQVVELNEIAAMTFEADQSSGFDGSVKQVAENCLDTGTLYELKPGYFVHVFACRQYIAIVHPEDYREYIFTPEEN